MNTQGGTGNALSNLNASLVVGNGNHGRDALPEPDRVSAFDAIDVLPVSGNRPVTPDSVADLLPSIENIGQQVPGIVFAHPELPGKYCCADGNRRALCQRMLGRKFMAILLDHAPTNRELRRIRISTNAIRKGMTADQIAADLEEHVAETGDTQEAAAEYFSLSPGYVSKLLAPSKRLCPDLHHLRDNPAISRDALRIIATMPTHELQKQLAERALATISAGGTVKRDLLERLAAQMKGGPRQAKKPRPLKLKYGGVRMAAEDGTLAAIRAFQVKLAEALKRLERDDLPPEFLAGFMK